MTRAIVTVVETRPFIRAAAALMKEGEREGLIDFLARNPTLGSVIQGSGGIRKIRWAGAGRGKRGGYRVIYYFHNEAMPLFLLTVYGKSQKADITADEKRGMRLWVNRIVQAYRKN